MTSWKQYWKTDLNVTIVGKGFVSTSWTAWLQGTAAIWPKIDGTSADWGPIQPCVRMYYIHKFCIFFIYRWCAKRWIECWECRIESGDSGNFHITTRFLYHISTNNTGHLCAQRMPDDMKFINIQAFVYQIQYYLGHFRSQLKNQNWINS